MSSVKSLGERMFEAVRKELTGAGNDPPRSCARRPSGDCSHPQCTCAHGQHIVMIGDIVTGFEAWGPFESGHDAIEWKGSTGVREMAHGQWYLMQLKEPIRGSST
jgi:hypothetical protein